VEIGGESPKLHQLTPSNQFAADSGQSRICRSNESQESGGNRAPLVNRVSDI
jgi:hypothetical protein